jgi:poly(3-hydroxybutyrate) depolymerase
MLRKPFVTLVAVCLAAAAPSLTAADLKPLTISVEGRPRTALIYLPDRPVTSGHPLVFVFHGHGGTSESAAR